MLVIEYVELPRKSMARMHLEPGPAQPPTATGRVEPARMTPTMISPTHGLKKADPDDQSAVTKAMMMMRSTASLVPATHQRGASQFAGRRHLEAMTMM